MNDFHISKTNHKPMDKLRFCKNLQKTKDKSMVFENPRFHIIFEKVSADNDKEKTLPKAFTIDRVYPNPFNPTVTIDYHLLNDSDINISVYDLKGAIVDRIFKGKMVSGNHQIEWVPTNISSGIYIFRFELKNTIINKKITFLK